VEKLIERPRHVEIQILGDLHGNLIYLAERECSLQRRHQKVLEECPSPFLDEDLRRRIGDAAVRLGKLAGYSNAGTVEFLVDQDRSFYFLEVNARLQVEHPVTELVLGIDLVKAQIEIASGQPLRWRQEDVMMRGAALECRICAEDPHNAFFPSPGLITRLEVPAGPGVRDDAGVYAGWSVPLEYDPLLSKLVVWGTDRAEAIARMRRALGEYRVSGIKTNINFFRRILDHPDFVRGIFDTGFIERVLSDGLMSQNTVPEDARRIAMLTAALDFVRRQASLQAARRTGPDRENAWKMAGREAVLNHWPVKGRP
jgi:acetyl-CoA carboxylase biotin carboxylase subunit